MIKALQPYQYKYNDKHPRIGHTGDTLSKLSQPIEHPGWDGPYLCNKEEVVYLVQFELEDGKTFEHGV